ncbi:hypothetical protein [uncultured Paludibaculum sp.]|uniref:hypothetical protein n=1 Tax=uncultured Paludibaculum sp. TaxID=1765020 RepID=UPI002AAADCD7|nr:hypothetical protein [uncultured Paludibaculum sp.]
MGQVEPIPIHDHALENLRYIRSAMERAGSFTAVPGVGGMVMGATALLAAWLAHRQTTPQGWVTVWLTEMVLAVAIGSLAMVHKARRSGAPLWCDAGRKFALSFAPPILAGALLTWPLYHAGLLHIVAASWLMLYGAAVVAGGAFSVRIVPAMGVAYFALGLIAMLAPPELKDLPLAAGFGGLHLVFGFWIYRRYGG